MKQDDAGHRTMFALVAIVTLVALALRLYRIDAQGAWIDEAFTISASASSWGEMLKILVDDFNHPPLHTILVRWWFDLFGVGVLQARVLSAIFGTLAVPALYVLGVLLFDRRTAVFASALLAISQLGIIYSQEARAYSLLLLLVIAGTAFFIRAFRSGSVRDFAFFVLTAALMLYTHYYSVFALVALLIFTAIFRRDSAIPSSWWLAALAATVLGYVPWLASGVVQSALQNPHGAVDHRGFAQLLSPLYALNWFNNGKLTGVRVQAPWWTFPIGCALFTVPALNALRRLRGSLAQERQAACLLALACVVPLLAVQALGLLHVVYDVRHISFAVAPYYLLVARGVMAVTTTRRRLVVAAILCYASLSFRADYFVPYKENYREALQLVATEAQAGDCAIFGAPDGNSYISMYWRSYYHGQAPPRLIPFADASSETDCHRVWFLWETTFWKAGALTVESVREKMANAYEPGQRFAFTGIDVELYRRR